MNIMYRYMDRLLNILIEIRVLEGKCHGQEHACLDPTRWTSIKLRNHRQRQITNCGRQLKCIWCEFEGVMEDTRRIDDLPCVNFL